MQKSEEYRNRRAKREAIESLGVDPYPASAITTESVATVLQGEETAEVGTAEMAEKGQTRQLALAGRLLLLRLMGKNAFGQLLDENKTIQIFFSRNGFSVDGLVEDLLAPMKFVEKMVDLGDFLWVEGHLFRTKVGELTLFVKRMRLLSKALLPPPDKHDGLVDKELCYRKRWMDLFSNRETMDRFEKRSKILSLIRRFYESHGYMEVETPVLQSIYGGAEARPFYTHLNALRCDFFLRISLEIQLKKILAGGMKRIFELSKVFRNEGIDRTHNPEFTMIESYAAYEDYHTIMDFTEKLFIHIAKQLYGSTNLGLRIDKQGKEHICDLKGPWRRISMKESIRLFAKIQVDDLSDADLRELLKSTSLDPKQIHSFPRGMLIAKIFEEYVEHHLIEPTFIIDHPIETTPLCKRHRNLKERAEGLVERFELFILGMEMANAYSELNDPVLQRELLENQERKRSSGDEEAHPMDHEFIEALESGMPPAGGLGIGVDRLVMLMTGASSIRDVLFFPLMKTDL